MIKSSGLAILMSVLCLTGFAQTDVDALRYSTLQSSGTARGLGLSGTFGSLGGDLTSLSVNPSGIAQYRSSEFVFTPGITSYRNRSSYIGGSSNTHKYNMTISNFGYVATKINKKYKRADDDAKEDKRKSKWATTSFGFAMNRLADFNSRTYFEGKNPNSSMVDGFMERLGRADIHPDDMGAVFPFDVDLAWQTFLIDTTMDSLGNISYHQNVPSGGLVQHNTKTTRGFINEYAVTLGGNYDNKLYVGATLGLPHLKYVEENTFGEIDINNDIDDFNEYNMFNYVKTSGMGVNLKLGLTYRVNEFLRIGGAFHSPTFYTLTDNYYSSINASYDNASFDYSSPDGRYNYYLTTPWRAIGSMAILFKDKGFISADYEITDYSYSFYEEPSVGLTSDGWLTNSVNDKILNKYGPAQNIRIGGELRADIFRFRGGYSHLGSPFRNGAATTEGDNSVRGFSLGFGIREKGYFIDMGYQQTVSKSTYVPYTLADASSYHASAMEDYKNKFLITVGFTF